MRGERKKTIGFVSLHATGQVNDRPGNDPNRPVYHISVVAELVETHPQTLRMYERMGLVNPQRTRNNIRLYSEADVEQVRRIQHLTQDLGVNLAGVEVVFKLLQELERLRQDAEHQTEELESFRREVERLHKPNGQNGSHNKA
jgi:MerR family transcriptional regulator/heat shock protein HspR